MIELNLDEWNSFYHLSKLLHLLVIRECEESQEDNSKIRSVENFLESSIWILRFSLLVFHFSCELYLSKFQSSQTWQIWWTTNFICGRWKFEQYLKNWTWLHKMRFSCRIMNKHVSIKCEHFFMRFGWKCENSIQDEWVGLMEFDERKIFKFCEKNALSWENKLKWIRSLSFHT